MGRWLPRSAFWKETRALNRGFLLSCERLLCREGLGGLALGVDGVGPCLLQWRECVTNQLFWKVGVYSQSVDPSNVTPSKTGERAGF